MKTPCEIVVLIDRSGSMQGLTDRCVNAVNKLLEDQKKIKGDCQYTQGFFSGHTGAKSSLGIDAQR